MNKRKAWLLIFLTFLILMAGCRNFKKGLVIITAKDASPLERLAAKETRRYLYLRTGELVSVEQKVNFRELPNQAIVISQKNFLSSADVLDAETGQKIAALEEQEFLLQTLPCQGKSFLIIAGGDGIGTLYGAYRLAENMGVRFFLDGDVIPEQKIALALPLVDELGKPHFRLRGIHPFHDFPEGPDWWNAEDYKMILAQLPKLRMNFFGLHTYPEGHPNAEPTVWIGLAQDCEKDGTVEFSYPSSYQNTLRGNWGYEARKTSDFHYGASELFERDDFGGDVMAGLIPEPKTLEDSNTLFNRTGALLRDAFEFGRSLGVKTCVGTEAPLAVPEWVKKRLLEQGKNPRESAVVKDLYKGIFSRIVTAYPLDYYWIWTDENWTWSDTRPEQVQAVVDDMKLALEAAQEIRAPFKMATCGWVLGPPSDRTLFDRVLPKGVALSCINREVGKAPVDPMFARIEGRSKWAIPWLEDDPALTSPQLWVGRMRRDAFDARSYGCEGLLGIHWRTRVLGPNVLALGWAAWDKKPWAPEALSYNRIEGPINGLYVSFGESPIAGTSEDSIYRNIRDRVLGYHIPVPDGIYEVILKFCEGEMKEKGRRVFDVSIQGKKVLEKLDIWERVGALRALDFRFSDIAVENGRLDVDFADRIHYPSIAGIVIQGKNFQKKINCGGPASGDYEADWPETPRTFASLDFYEDWARTEFGGEAFSDIARVFAQMDGRLPQPCIWTGPGGIKPDPRPWEEAKKDYAFVDELSGLRSRIKGKGNQARFDYWLSTFLYMREIAHLECLWAEYDKALEKVKSPANEKARATLAGQTLLPLRVQMVEVLRQIFGYLLATVSNSGEMGTIANWEQHLLPTLMQRPGEELQKILEKELPLQAQLAKDYEGRPRIIVPAARTLLRTEEPLRLRVIILSRTPPFRASLFWRELGKGKFSEVPLERASRSVWKVSFPPFQGDLEYYIKVQADSEEVFFPPTAPLINQTVIRN